MYGVPRVDPWSIEYAQAKKKSEFIILFGTVAETLQLFLKILEFAQHMSKFGYMKYFGKF